MGIIKLQIIPYYGSYILAYESTGTPVIAEAFIKYGVYLNEIIDILTEYGMFITGTTFKIINFKTKDGAQKALEYLDSYILMKRLST